MVAQVFKIRKKNQSRKVRSIKNFNSCRISVDRANQSVGKSKPRMVEDEDGSIKKTKMLFCKYTSTQKKYKLKDNIEQMK